MYNAPEPGEPGGSERLVRDLSELENTEEGGEAQEDHHQLHQKLPPALHIINHQHSTMLCQSESSN